MRSYIKSYKGMFTPRNPQKYKGDATKIVWRSTWEADFMLFLDGHPDVLEWSSEEVIIPYRSPIDGKVHRYFPDFFVKMRERTGKVVIKLIEIKPKKQTVPPKKKKSRSARYINEVKTWGINSSKWEAAKKFCDEKNWKFEILTENELRNY